MAFEKQIFINNGDTATNEGITAVQTSVVVADGSVFPTPATDEYFMATMDDGSDIEVVKVTAVATNTLTIVRAQEGTSGVAFLTGTTIQMRNTKGTMDRWVQNVSEVGDTVIHRGLSICGEDADAVTFNAMDHGVSDQAVIWTAEVDLATLADDIAIITIPSGVDFFLDEVGFVCTVWDTVTVWPVIDIGTATAGAQIVSAQTIASEVDAANTRDKAITQVADIETISLAAIYVSVTTAATATSMDGRFYFRGLAIEQQA